jgi:hypothetical protein
MTRITDGGEQVTLAVRRGKPMIVRGWQIDETDILDEHDGFAFTVADLIGHVREQSIHSGNVVHVEWKLPVEAPQHVKTILIVYEGIVYSGVFSLPNPPHRDAKVIRFPEDLSPVRLADCDYWADLPERPYQ